MNLTGGDREYGLLNVDRYLKEYASNKKLSELALQLGMADADVDARLLELGLSAQEEERDEKAIAAPAIIGLSRPATASGIAAVL